MLLLACRCAVCLVPCCAAGSYLRQRGVPARQFDAPDIGFITSDDFGNADIIYEQTLPKVGCVAVLRCAVLCWDAVAGPIAALLGLRVAAVLWAQAHSQPQSGCYFDKQDFS